MKERKRKCKELLVSLQFNCARAEESSRYLSGSIGLIRLLSLLLCIFQHSHSKKFKISYYTGKKEQKEKIPKR